MPTLALDTWACEKYANVEHIAPRTKSAGWSTHSYQYYEIERLSNLTLNPQRANSPLSNRSWHQKSLMFSAIAAETEGKVAAVRISMNAVPSAMILMFRKLFDLTETQITFWSRMLFVGLAFICLLAVSPSSTAVDRAALYWIPLQFYLWSRWPAVRASTQSGQFPWVFGVLIYSLALLFVWLLYANHSHFWLPYQFYPWVWLWQ
jgi:hypothetical protein